MCDMYRFSSVQSQSCVQVFVTPWTAAHQDFSSITNSQSLTNSCSLSQWCHPAISSSIIPFSCLQSFPASGFKWVNSSHEVAKVLEFQLQHQSFQWYLGLIFRMDWLDLLAVQGTLKSLLQHHSSKASIFSPQLSLQSNSHIHTWLLEKPQPWLDRPLLAK